jgi:bifunctional DNase/RNase/DNA-binding transcriptional MerR regulator
VRSMDEPAELERTWKVGELARATGLTIRALHHYDDIGLLVPGRTDGGHRAYSGADVERLYRVLALRGVGLALDEIGAVLDADGVSLVDTVRRHVAAVERDIEQRRRLLDRLRGMLDALEHASAPTADDLLGAVEAMTVVEATVEDVVTRERWEDIWELTQPHVVLLREAGSERVLPIWIGEPEASALVVQRRGGALARPMGHDLMLSLLGAFDARVERVVIDRLDGNTFFATLTVVSGGIAHEVDARPSDALNLALRAGTPIHVASELIDAAGITAWPHAVETLGDGGPPPWTTLGEQRELYRTPDYAIHEHSPELLHSAAAQAHELGNRVVGPEHLLLAILADRDDPSAALLARHGVSLETARDAVAARLAGAPEPPLPDGETRLSRRATFALHRASVEARRRGTLAIGAPHLLLALAEGWDLAELAGLGDDDVKALRDEMRAALDA